MRDNIGQEDELRKIRMVAKSSDVQLQPVSDQSDYRMIVASSILLVVSIGLWSAGILGVEALLALVPFGFAVWSFRRSKQVLSSLRDKQVEEHGMKTGDPKFWGRGENKN